MTHEIPQTPLHQQQQALYPYIYTNTFSQISHSKHSRSVQINGGDVVSALITDNIISLCLFKKTSYHEDHYDTLQVDTVIGDSAYLIYESVAPDSPAAPDPSNYLYLLWTQTGAYNVQRYITYPVFLKDTTWSLNKLINDDITYLQAKIFHKVLYIYYVIDLTTLSIDLWSLSLQPIESHSYAFTQLAGVKELQDPYISFVTTSITPAKFITDITDITDSTTIHFPDTTSGLLQDDYIIINDNVRKITAITSFNITINASIPVVTGTQIVTKMPDTYMFLTFTQVESLTNLGIINLTALRISDFPIGVIAPFITPTVTFSEFKVLNEHLQMPGLIITPDITTATTGIINLFYDTGKYVYAYGSTYTIEDQIISLNIGNKMRLNKHTEASEDDYQTVPTYGMSWFTGVTHVWNNDFIYLIYSYNTDYNNGLRVIKLLRYKDTDDLVKYAYMWITRKDFPLYSSDNTLSSRSVQFVDIHAICATNGDLLIFARGCLQNQLLNGDLYMWRIREYVMDLGHSQDSRLANDFINIIRDLLTDTGYTSYSFHQPVVYGGEVSGSSGSTDLKDITVESLTKGTQSVYNLTMSYINVDYLFANDAARHTFISSVAKALYAITNNTITYRDPDSQNNIDITYDGVVVSGVSSKLMNIINQRTLTLSFIMNGPLPCITKGTYVLKYRESNESKDVREWIKIENLQIGDYLMTTDVTMNALCKSRVLNILITQLVSTHRSSPCIIPKHYFGKNRPFIDLLISSDHMILEKPNILSVPEHGAFSKCKEGQLVTYYHVICENYVFFLANGLEVESLRDSESIEPIET